MIPEVREAFNRSFKEQYYASLLADVVDHFGEPCPFRISETPVFISRSLKIEVMEACEAILHQVENLDFGSIRSRFVPEHLQCPSHLGKPHFLAIDFGLVEEGGDIVPRLIELQAFPSLFYYQNFLGKAFYRHYPNLPAGGFQYFLNGLDEDRYLERLRDLLLGGHAPENVILLEIFPEKQKTRIDFTATRQALGLEVVCYTKVIREGRKLYYEKHGKRIPIYRIYNRVIQDELQRIPNLRTSFSLSDEVEVEWVTHPDWFFMISKSIMPMLEHKSIPPSYYVPEFPEDEDPGLYVLKPLFSFAGTGINLNPDREMLNQLADPHRYLLQRKVTYAPLVKTKTDKAAKVELRILYIRNSQSGQLQPVINLTRMAMGPLINVSHLTGERWIGSSISLFQD